MEITTALIERVAELSRLTIPAESVEQVRSQFQDILTYVETIAEYPLNEEALPGQLVSSVQEPRSDEVVVSVSTKDALSNAPKHNQVFFKVPKVLE